MFCTGLLSNTDLTCGTALRNPSEVVRICQAKNVQIYIILYIFITDQRKLASFMWICSDSIVRFATVLQASGITNKMGSTNSYVDKILSTTISNNKKKKK